MDIESGFCQLPDGGKVARSEIVVATRVDTEDENFSSFHVVCCAPLSGILLCLLYSAGNYNTYLCVLQGFLCRLRF